MIDYLREDSYDLKTYLALIVSLANKFGFVPAGKNTDWQIATYIQANQIIDFYEPNQNDLAVAENIIEYIQNVEEKNDYFSRIKEIAFNGDYLWNESAIAASMYAVWKKSFDAVQSDSDHIGNPGDKITVTATITDVKEIPDSGFGISFFTKLVTTDKNIITWYSKIRYTIGTVLTLTAKINKHEEWDGQNQTRVFYVKVIENQNTVLN